MEGKSSGTICTWILSARLHALQHIQAAAAALALGAVGRVGHYLQLAQHELRNHEHAVDKSRFGDVGDAAVDDHAGIQYLGAAARGLVAGKDGIERRRVQQIALVCAHQQAHVGHEQKDKDLQGRGVGFSERRGTQHETKERRAEDAEHATHYGADQPPQGERAHAQFEDDHRAGGGRSDRRAFPTGLDAERAEEIANRGKQNDKKKT